MRVSEAIRAAALELESTSETPRLDAELLAAHLLGVEREAMLLDRLDNEIDGAAYEALVARRADREPLAYITGEREFWSLAFAVRPGVLIPRPDSETLIEAAVEHFGERPPERILDLGTGSGALLLAALSHWPDAKGIGVDRSEAALECACDNAERLGLNDRAKFAPGDWAAPVSGCFDLILCNPPYVEDDADLAADVREHEPQDALFAGPDGLDAYRILAPQIGPLLAPGGIACIEIGHRQAEAVSALFAAQGLECAVRHDLAGRDRALLIHG